MEKTGLLSISEKNHLQNSEDYPEDFEESKETPKLIQELEQDSNFKNDLLEKKKSLGIDENLENGRSIQVKNNQEKYESNITRVQFWNSSWKERKKIAKQYIKNLKQKNEETFQTLAYKGDHEQILKLYNQGNAKPSSGDENISEVNTEKEDKLAQISKVLPVNEDFMAGSVFQKDIFGLTPLIYAIWGEEKTKDSKKITSKLIFKLYNDNEKSKRGAKYSEYSKLPVPFDSELESELGHALIHGIIDEKLFLTEEDQNYGKYINEIREILKDNKNFELRKKALERRNHSSLALKEIIDNEQNQETIEVLRLYYEEKWIYNLIQKDNDESISYYFETRGFRLIYHNIFNRTIQIYNKMTSIAYFSLIVKSIKCANVIFIHLIEKVADPESYYMLDILSKELQFFFSFNSLLIGKLLDEITIVREKSMKVNIEQIPNFRMIDSSPDRIEKFAYETFDDMPDAESLIKSVIINSKIRLPTIAGSLFSIKFINSLTSSDNLKLYQNTLIKSYLQYKWERIWYMIFFHSVLMWLNIPLIVILVFVRKYDLSILIIFSIINALLVIFELSQLYSLRIYEYLGNVDARHAGLGIRFLTLFLIFLPNFQPYSCVIYFCISASFILGDESKESTLGLILVYGIYICLLFPAFWSEWEYVGYLMMGVGSLIFFCFCTLKFFFSVTDSVRFYFDLISRFIQLAILIDIIFMNKYGFALFIANQFLSGSILFYQVLNHKDQGAYLKILIDLFIVLVFSINFYTHGTLPYYLINSFTLFFSVFNVCLSLKRFPDDQYDNRNSPWILNFSYFSGTLIGINLEDLNSLKLFILVTEVSLLVFFKIKLNIGLTKIIKNLLTMFLSWNLLDCTRIVLCTIWLTYQFSSKTNLGLTYSLAVLTLIRGLTGFRCFKVTRYYVRLIMNSIKDILPFILIFFYSTLSFGIICSIYKDISMSEIWMYPYDLNIGASSHEDTFDMNYISFFFATVINVIIMLNLLISILGDSFDQFQVNAAEIDFMEMAQTLVEFETMLFWRRNKKDDGEYLVGILNEAKGNKRQGKITKIEFFELKNEIGTIKNDIGYMKNEIENIKNEFKREYLENDKRFDKIQEEIIRSNIRIISAIEKPLKDN